MLTFSRVFIYRQIMCQNNVWDFLKVKFQINALVTQTFSEIRI